MQLVLRVNIKERKLKKEKKILKAKNANSDVRIKNDNTIGKFPTYEG